MNDHPPGVAIDDPETDRAERVGNDSHERVQLIERAARQVKIVIARGDQRRPLLDGPADAALQRAHGTGKRFQVCLAHLAVRDAGHRDSITIRDGGVHSAEELV